MTGRQIILQVLKDIKKESEINPDPNWVIFHFTKRGIEKEGCLNYDQQKRILIKLHNQKVIEILLPHTNSTEKESYTDTSIDPINDPNLDNLQIKILSKFNFVYFYYYFMSLKENTWNYVNPFWLAWKIVNLVVFVVEWLWNKSKLITIFIGLLTLLAVDYSLAWANLKFFLRLFGIKI